MASSASIPRHRTLRLTKCRPLRFGLRRLFLWFTAAAIILCVSAWLTRWPCVTIAGPAISTTQTYTISSSSDEIVDGLSLKVSGDIDGRATIQLGEVFRVHSIGPGKFELDIGPHEYYETEAKVLYLPQNVSRGHVRVRYKFHGLL